MLPSEKLAELGLELPAVATPVAAYVPAVIDRGVVRTSGQIPVVNGEPVCIGAVGEDGADPEDAKDAARVCALNALAAAASVAGGIDNLAGVVKVVGFVSSRPDFYGQAGVINGYPSCLARSSAASTRAAPSESPRCPSTSASRSKPSSSLSERACLAEARLHWIRFTEVALRAEG